MASPEQNVRSLTLRVNGRSVAVTADADSPLLWVLRDDLGLTGTRFGCGIGACGACTVHLDGAGVRSCSLRIADVEGRSITTIEGAADNGLNAVQRAWIEEDVPQCGYCQSGQIMSAMTLLTRHPEPTDAEIDAEMAGNLCRCGTYDRIRRAIHRAAGLIR
jgi:isoquinoline 1-oxidoreductase subunit alpha